MDRAELEEKARHRRPGDPAMRRGRSADELPPAGYEREASGGRREASEPNRSRDWGGSGLDPATSGLEQGSVPPGTAEVCVADNASRDGSPEMVREEFPTVRIISNESNRGFAAATNQGLRESRGRYLMLLNPDTKSTPDFMGVLIRFLESHPRAGAVAPRLLGSDGEQQVS